MNEITKRWKTTGLLEGLQNEENQDECAAVLNHVAQILIRDDPNPTDTERKSQHEKFCGLVLPVARRIYDRLYPSKIKFPDVEWFVKDCREFSDSEKHVRLNPDKVKEESVGYMFDDVRFMKDIIKYKDIKVGMLLVPDLDGFMLGNRWLVTEKREDGSFYAQHHSCGKRNPYVCSDWIIKSDDDCERGFWYQIGETLELWQKKFNKVDGKIIL